MAQPLASPYASYEQLPQQPYYHAPPSSSPYAYDSYTPFTSPYTFHETYPSSYYQPSVENQENMHSSYMPYHTCMSSRFEDTNQEAQADTLANIRKQLDELEQRFARLTKGAMDHEKEELPTQPRDDPTYEMFTSPYMSSYDQSLSFIALKTEHEIENINVLEVLDPREDVHRVEHDKDENMQRFVILPEVLDPREVMPIIDVVKEEMSLEGEREEFERDELEIENFKQEEKVDDIGLLDVRDMHVIDTIDGLEDLVMSKNYEIHTFMPLVPSPNLPEPLELYISILKPYIIPIVDQLEE